MVPEMSAVLELFRMVVEDVAVVLIDSLLVGLVLEVVGLLVDDRLELLVRVSEVLEYLLLVLLRDEEGLVPKFP